MKLDNQISLKKLENFLFCGKNIKISFDLWQKAKRRLGYIINLGRDHREDITGRNCTDESICSLPDDFCCGILFLGSK